MNKRTLLILAGFSLLTTATIFAANNEKGIEYYRAELYDAAKIFFLQQTNQSVSEQAEMYYYLGLTYYQLNQEDSASYYYRKATEVLPEYPFGYIGEGKMQLKTGNKKAAEELFKKANNYAKKDPSVQTAIAEVYVDLGDYINAMLALDKARKINNKYSGIYIVEGDMLMKQGKVGEACGRYDNAINFNKTDKLAYLKSAKVYKSINTNVALNEYLNKLISIDPGYIPAYAIIGDIYREAGMYKNALDAYEKFIAIPGVPLQQHEFYAQLLYFLNQYEQASNQIDFVLSKDPNNLVMKRLKAYNYFRLENYTLGLEIMKQFMEEMPEERHIYQDYTTLGQLALKEKQPQLAMDAFQKAIEMDSTKAENYKEIASAAFSSGLFPESVTYFEKYLIKDPLADAADYFFYAQANSYAASYYIDPNNMASVRTPEEDEKYEADFRKFVQAADNAYEEIIKQKPDMSLGYMGRANMNAMLDKYDGDKKRKVLGYAKPLYEEAITFLLNNNEDGSKNKDLLAAYFYLRSYYAAIDDTSNLIEYCKKILQLDPNDEPSKGILKFYKIKF